MEIQSSNSYYQENVDIGQVIHLQRRSPEGCPAEGRGWSGSTPVRSGSAIYSETASFLITSPFSTLSLPLQTPDLFTALSICRTSRKFLNLYFILNYLVSFPFVSFCVRNFHYHFDQIPDRSNLETKDVTGLMISKVLVHPAGEGMTRQSGLCHGGQEAERGKKSPRTWDLQGPALSDLRSPAGPCLLKFLHPYRVVPPPAGDHEFTVGPWGTFTFRP